MESPISAMFIFALVFHLFTTVMSSTPIWKDIFVAALSNDLDSVKYFIDVEGDPVTITDEEGKSVALIAAEHGRLSVLKYILDKDASLLEKSDTHGNTVLQRAAERGDLDMVKYLVEERGADFCRINVRVCGNTAVHFAAQKGKFDVLEYFVDEKHVDVNLPNLIGEPPLFSAAEKPYMRIIEYLIEERRADPTILNSNKDNILFKSAKRGDLMLPKYLLDKRKLPFDLNWRNENGYTALNLASTYNKVGFVHFMIQKNASIFIADSLNRTALHHAAARGYFQLCKLLVENGASYDAEDVYGYTPVHLATNESVRKLFFLKAVKNRNTERARRSVPSCVVKPGRGGDRYESLKRLGHESSVGDVSSYSLNTVFLVADTVFRYVRGGSTYHTIAHPSSLSKRELLQKKIDSLATDVIDGLFSFENHYK